MKQISHEYKFYFIGIPKTGCTSVRAALSNFLYKERRKNQNQKFKHFTNLEYKKIEKLNNYFSFAFVRNPFDRMVSQYRFSGKRWFKKYEELSNYKPTFINYVKYLVGEGRPFSRHRSPLLNVGYDKDWSMMQFIEGGVNFIGKFENLQQDFNVICDKIGIPQQKLPHLNKTNHKHYTKYYNDETRQIVAEKYKKDIEYFGYKFGA